MIKSEQISDDKFGRKSFKILINNIKKYCKNITLFIYLQAQ